MQISIKDATFHDLKEINKILRLSKGHWGYPKEFLDRFMKQHAITSEFIKNHSIQLLYADERLAGFYNFGMNSENEFELDNFFLHPDYIGKGLGYQLWQACCQTALENGKDEFIIWSDPHAETFYLKMGCEKIGVRKSLMMPNRLPPILRFKIKK